MNGTLVTRLDVQDSESIRSAIDAGLARFGRIDALVNNAGYGAYGPLEATSTEKIRRQFAVNLLGLLATTQAVLPHFRANRSGTIIKVSSVGGRIAFPPRYAIPRDQVSRWKGSPSRFTTNSARSASG